MFINNIKYTVIYGSTILERLLLYKNIITKMTKNIVGISCARTLMAFLWGLYLMLTKIIK